MLLDVETLLRLWTGPLPQDDEAAADAFRLSAIWMVGDWMSALVPAGMVQAPPVGEGPTGAS